MLKQIDDYRFLLTKDHRPGMTVEGMVYANEKLIESIKADKTLEQIANSATLPHLVGRALAMPDAHQGYGFCIGAVVATDAEDGIVSAGAVGYDINCGVRLLSSDIHKEDAVKYAKLLADNLFRTIPSGTGVGSQIKLNKTKLDDVLRLGAKWGVENGYGYPEDVLHIEECGMMPGAKPEFVSQRAKERGGDQLGTLGSGNHFIEIQYVEEIFDEETASKFGLTKDSLTVMVHTGSRGLGHQVCTDYLELMQDAMKRYKISVVDRELAYVPIHSPEGEKYIGAMNAAANFAFANRQIISHIVREAFHEFFPNNRLKVVYDVVHNMAKFEEYNINGISRRVLVHRKGATRAFPKKYPGLPEDYKEVGQPVLIPGSMGTSSYVLVGTELAIRETFGSSCHGAGRRMSRHKAKKLISAEELIRQLSSMGITVRGASNSGLTEEMPDAYKDVSEVVNVVHNAGLARRVARMKPIAVVKG